MKAKRFILRDRGIRDNALEYIKDLPSDTVWQVVINKYVKPHSGSQQGYLRVLYDILSEDSGWEKDDIHDHMREKAGLWTTLELPNGETKEVLKSTKDMNVIEMSELIETTLRSGVQEFEVTLPAPSQVWAA